MPFLVNLIVGKSVVFVAFCEKLLRGKIYYYLKKKVVIGQM
jgi:hypothetical protein